MMTKMMMKMMMTIDDDIIIITIVIYNNLNTVNQHIFEHNNIIINILMV